MEMKERR